MPLNLYTPQPWWKPNNFFQKTADDKDGNKAQVQVGSGKILNIQNQDPDTKPSRSKHEMWKERRYTYKMDIQR